MRSPHVRPEESALVERARSGDLDAFDRLARAHLATLYSVLFRLVGNHEDAEDLAQDALERAFRALHLYRGDASFRSWVVRIAVHLARDHQRRGGRVALAGILELEAPEPRPDPRQSASTGELVRAAAAAIAALPESLRVALVLRVLEGMDYVEVARATAVRPGTVRTQVMKARRLLAQALGPWLGGPDGGAS